MPSWKNFQTTSHPYLEALIISSFQETLTFIGNKPENLDTISMQEMLDMHDLNQHIHTQAHKNRNSIDQLISNTANIIHDITNKDYISDHSFIEWKFQISRKSTEKIQKSRCNLAKINEENFNIDLKKNLQMDIKNPPT